jgi:hypothetical protein
MAVDPEVERKKKFERNKANRSDPAYRAKEAAYTRSWYRKNSEKLAQARKIRRDDPVLAAADKAVRQANRNRKAELDRALLKNEEWKSKRSAYKRSWSSAPGNRSRRNRREAERRKNIPELRVQQNTRTLIRLMIKQGSNGALRHLPYTIPELCEHLEKQFTKGMSWENYGPYWHVDHILPVASFKIDTTGPANCAEFQACWALTNLRPLRTFENLSKGADRRHLI